MQGAGSIEKCRNEVTEAREKGGQHAVWTVGKRRGEKTGAQHGDRREEARTVDKRCRRGGQRGTARSGECRDKMTGGEHR